MKYEYAIKLACGQIEENNIPIMFRQVAKNLQGTKELLNYIQNKKWEEMKAERDRLENAGIPFKDKYFDYDLRSAFKLEIAKSASESAIKLGLAQADDISISWTMKDNSVMDLTYTDVLQIPLIVKDYSNMLHEKGRELRQRIFESNDIVEINNIKWE
jgi:hypothetical protein